MQLFFASNKQQPNKTFIDKKEIILKKLKLTIVMAAVAVLSACGGGGNDDAGVDNSAMTLSVNPNTEQTLPANSSLKLTMAASVRRAGTADQNSVTEMIWAVNALGGETKTPVLSNASCAGSNISGAQAGCETLLSIPADVTTGKFNVVATAKSSAGVQRTENFTLNVNNTVYNLSAGNAQVIEQAENGSFGVVQLEGNLSGQNGPKAANIQWKQVSGPTQVLLANEHTFTASFIPTVLGIYVFELTVVADGKNFTATTTVEAQRKPN